jgi:hypothetical protein
MRFLEVLARHGFREQEERAVGSARGAILYTARPNPFMTYTVHAYPDRTAVFSWEFAIAEYLGEKGITVGDGETLNLFAYPSHDVPGPQEGEWLEARIVELETVLASVRLDHPA